MRRGDEETTTVTPAETIDQRRIAVLEHAQRTGYERLPYSATKGAVVALSEALALSTRPRGVGVTVLCPGPVATNIVESIQAVGKVPKPRSPGLPVIAAEVVGEQVVEANLH